MLQRALNRRGAEPAQAGTAEASAPTASAPVQRKPNATGLPDRLKAGVEQLSGLAMDDVRVHYNSPKPATVQAHAYAQGTEIHLGPGQEQHLPHEAWHVVQQKQGRVKPTLQMKGMAINDDAGMEREADVMGARAFRTKPRDLRAPQGPAVRPGNPFAANVRGPAVQRKVGFEIEVTNIGVDLKSSKDDDSEDEQYMGMGGFGTAFGSGGFQTNMTAPLIDDKAASDADDKHAKAADAPSIKKGDTIFRGDGWRLTPDGDGDWYGEFITDPVDETADFAKIEKVLTSVTEYAKKIQALKRFQYYDVSLVGDYRLQRGPGEFDGSFHITGGIKLDQLATLLTAMSEEAKKLSGSSKAKPDQKKAKANQKDEKDEGDVKSAVGAVGNQAPMPAAKVVPKDSASAEYKGLVALLTSYVTAQQPKGKEPAPTYAKQNLPVLSRTNLGAIRNKVKDMPSLEVFTHDVLTAAHLAKDGPLFPKGISDSGQAEDQGSIEANPHITIGKWLAGIYGRKDLSWNDSLNSMGGKFSFEDVGPELPYCNCLPWLGSGRAIGAIVEIRNADGNLVPLEKWVDVGKSFAEIFMNLNK
jgi:hypothetical protein